MRMKPMNSEEALAKLHLSRERTISLLKPVYDMLIAYIEMPEEIPETPDGRYECDRWLGEEEL